MQDARAIRRLAFHFVFRPTMASLTSPGQVWALAGCQALERASPTNKLHPKNRGRNLIKRFLLTLILL